MCVVATGFAGFCVSRFAATLHYAALQATKVDLLATRAVVEEQALTERALLSEAAQTTASLGVAERDVEGLREKVTRQVWFGAVWCGLGWAGCAGL